jgi:hypothetical protein
MASGEPLALGAIRVLALASAVRNNGSSASFSFGTDVKPFDTGNAYVYAVNFPDGVTWAIHVPTQGGTGFTPQSLSSFVESQATILIQLEQAGFRWTPKLIHYDTGHSNLVQLPYLVLNWIQGTELEWTDTVPSRPEDRAKILRQVVDIRLELAERTKVSRTDQALPCLFKLTLSCRPRYVCIGLSNQRCQWQDYAGRGRRRTSPQCSGLPHTPRTAKLRCQGLP